MIKATIVGRIARSPQIKDIEGQEQLLLRLDAGVTERDESGQWDTSNVIDVLWSGDNINMQYLRKGSTIMAHGTLLLSTYMEDGVPKMSVTLKADYMSIGF